MKDLAKDMAELLEAKSVSTEQYRIEMDGGIFERYEDVPELYRPRLEHGRDGTGTYDYVGMLMRGKEWVIEPLRELQPHSYRAFQEAVGPLLLGIVLIKDLMNPDGPPKVRPILFFDASGRMIEVFPEFPGNTYEERKDRFGVLLSLPEALAKSWLWRTQGWRVPSEPFQGPLSKGGLIGRDWNFIEDTLKSYDQRRWKWMLPKVLERIPDAVVTRHHPDDGSPYQWTQMRCFLDTRPPGVSGPLGDQFFVFDQKRDQAVYHIHRGDIDDIRILRDPADAIDRYCAHVLRRKPGEFDFSPWSESIAKF